MQSLFPQATWFVSQAEATEYRANGATSIIEHPNDVLGSGKKYQWVLDHTEGPVFLVDDDVHYIWCNVGRVGRRIVDPAAIQQLVENACHCAQEIGTPYFGFANSWDVRKYFPNDPFSLNGWVGSAFGFTDRSMRYERGLFFRTDVYFSLHVLLEKRVIWRDNRFAFVCERFTNVGGLSIDRTEEKDFAEIRKIVDEWGEAVKFSRGKRHWNVYLNVQRKQPISF